MKHVTYVFSLWAVTLTCCNYKSNMYKLPWDLSSYESCTLQPLVVPDGGHITAGLQDALGDTLPGL